MPKTDKDPKKAAKAAVKGAKGTVHLAILCDESGSMGRREEGVVNGVNEFLHSFRDTDADVKVTLAFFDAPPAYVPDEPRVRYKHTAKAAKKVKDVQHGDYVPRGGTPLNDAVIEMIRTVDKECGKKDRAFVVIITDGQENMSEVKDPKVVADLISKYEEKGWSFLYLGTDQASHAAAANIGLAKAGQSFMFAGSNVGTQSMMRSASHLAASYTTKGKEAYDSDAIAVAAATSGTLGEDGDEIVERTLGDTSGGGGSTNGQ